MSSQVIRECPFCHTRNRVNPRRIHKALCGRCHRRLDATYYDVLEVSPNASPEEIKRQYRKLVQRWHPDKHPGDGFALEYFKALNQAYRTLMRPAERALYDEPLRRSGTGSSFHRKVHETSVPSAAEAVDDVVWMSILWLCAALAMFLFGLMVGGDVPWLSVLLFVSAGGASYMDLFTWESG
ncbi:hypothetical protein GCM10025857_17660 [Alicyclobacillus contaminans]|nr:hypothetical protein GCM10025857_17660 [Alicyclobacillus contaminans]